MTIATDFLNFIAKRGVNTVGVVGGAVRDMLRERAPHDIDVAAIISDPSPQPFHSSHCKTTRHTSPPVRRLVEALSQVFHLEGPQIRKGLGRFAGLEVQVSGLHSLVVSIGGRRRRRIPDVFIRSEGPSLFVANWELSINHCALLPQGRLISHARMQKDLSDSRAHLIPGFVPLNWRAVVRATRLSLQLDLALDEVTVSRLSAFLRSEGRLSAVALATDPYLLGEVELLQQAFQSRAPKSELYEKLLIAVAHDDTTPHPH